MQMHLVIPDPDDVTSMPIFDLFYTTPNELTDALVAQLEPGVYDAVSTDESGLEYPTVVVVAGSIGR